MFVDLRNIGDDIIALIDPADALTLAAGFKAVVAAWFIGYLLFVGYMTLAGRTRAPLADIIIKLVAFTAISAFAFNVGGWYTFAINSVNGLNTWASSGSTNAIYLSLDTGLSEIDQLHQVFIKNDNFTGLRASIGASIVYISYYVFAVFITALLVINALTLKLIIFIFPIAVATLFFPMVKSVFERWLEIAISNILTILFISTFFNAIWDKIHTKMSDIISDAPTVEIFTVAFSLAGLFIMGFFLIKVSVSFAEALTRASAERLPGAAARGSAVTAAGVGFLGAKGVSGAAKKVSGASQKSPNVFGGKGANGGGGGNKGGSSSSSLNKNSNSKNAHWQKVGSINKYKKAKDGE